MSNIEKQEIMEAISEAASKAYPKEVMTSEETAKYMGVSLSYLYKLTSNKEIPHFKSQTGRMCYFNRKEVEAWMQANRVKTNEQNEQEAQARCMKKGGKR